jgi:hypothetical protein
VKFGLGKLTTPKNVSGLDDTRLFPFEDLSKRWEVLGVQKGNQLTRLFEINGAN